MSLNRDMPTSTPSPCAAQPQVRRGCGAAATIHKALLLAGRSAVGLVCCVALACFALIAIPSAFGDFGDPQGVREVPLALSENSFGTPPPFAANADVGGKGGAARNSAAVSESKSIALVGQVKRSGGANPAGFEWTVATATDAQGTPDPSACMITGYTYNGRPNATITGQTVQVPAVIGTQRVVAFEGPAGSFANLKCEINFTEAVNLVRFGTETSSIFEGSGIRGTLDLSNCGQLSQISERAFYGSLSLAGVVFPSQLREIGYNAFNGCTSLAQLDFAPDSQLQTIGNTAFHQCSSLTSVTLPATVQTLGGMAFYECTSLAQLDFGPGSQLQTIGNATFMGCSMLKTITLPASLTIIGARSFSLSGLTALTVPASVTSIGNFAFENCTDFARLEFAPGSQLQNIGVFSFFGSGVTSVTIPARVTMLGQNAFQNCTSLSQLKFAPGSQLQKIGVSTFRNTKLTGELTIPASVTLIEDMAFYGAGLNGSGLARLTFESTTEPITILGEAFRHNKIENDPFKNRPFEGLGRYSFANNLISEPVSFENYNPSTPELGILAHNPNITEVTVSASWRVISPEMFLNNKALATVNIPAGNALTRIGNNAFSGCTSLASIDFTNTSLRDSIYNDIALGNAAFSGCSALESIHIGSKGPGTPFTIGDNAFNGCSKLTDFVLPAETGPLDNRMPFVIRNNVFLNTSLGTSGAFPFADRAVKRIGEGAFKNAKLTEAVLPSTVAFIGNQAFANNHMTSLELPANPALDATKPDGTPANVGTDILANQTVEGPFLWGEDEQPGKAVVVLSALRELGVGTDRLVSVGLNVPGVGEGLQPENLQPANPENWQTTLLARYPSTQVSAAGTTFTYSLALWREGGTGPLSQGSVTMGSAQKAVPFTFYYYSNESFTGEPEQHIQWVGEGSSPLEHSGGIPNFGREKPGYYLLGGAWDHLRNAGWRTGSGLDGAGEPVDPATQVAVDASRPAFYNRWIGNAYSVRFDNNWDTMVGKDAGLGQLAVPDDPASDTVPHKEHVQGTMDLLTGCAYGTEKNLPENRPPENGFKMGGYRLVGWATSPDLAADELRPGKNFFEAGGALATPDPIPADGGEVVLFAQWETVNFGEAAPELAGFLFIPREITLKPFGDRIYSTPTAPDAAPGDHAVELKAMSASPGASWPAGQVYQVSVVRPSAEADLITISPNGSDGSSGTGKRIDVLTDTGDLYDPGTNANDNPTDIPMPLVTINPHVAEQAKGSFSLRSSDSLWAFMANTRYSGTMTFRIDIVPETAS